MFFYSFYINVLIFINKWDGILRNDVNEDDNYIEIIKNFCNTL